VAVVRNVGRIIKEARLDRGWTQAQVAALLNHQSGWGTCTANDVYRWETSRRRPGAWAPHIDAVLSLNTDDGGSTVDRRRFITAGSASVLGAATPAIPAEADIQAIRHVVTSLGNTAAEIGGTHILAAAVSYWKSYVLPRLATPTHGTTAAALHGAASSLSHLIGWMAQDNGDTRLAATAYTRAHTLAQPHGHADLAATALRGSAMLASDTGHRAQAQRLASECITLADRVDHPWSIAYYAATLAQTAAADGDHTTAHRYIDVSARQMQRPAHTSDAWSAHYTPGRWAHDIGMVLSSMGHHTQALEYLREAINLHGLNRQRTRAVVLADMGAVHLRNGDTDNALSRWQEFASVADGVTSGKVARAARDIHERLFLVADNHVAVPLQHRMRHLGRLAPDLKST
jgi:tetratricopeptide (TPR) repeat protein